jgi:hypothetical protein
MTDLPTNYVSIPRQMYYEFSSIISISDRLKPDNRGRNERYPVRSEVGELAANSMVPDERWPQGASRPPLPRVAFNGRFKTERSVWITTCLDHCGCSRSP